jgi:hypothetical protein
LADGPAEFKQAYEQKRDLGQITLKIVAHDEQKRDSAYITLKFVTGGWRTAGNDESNEESSAENVRGRCDGRRKLVFRAGSPKNNFRRPMAQRD